MFSQRYQNGNAFSFPDRRQVRFVLIAGQARPHKFDWLQFRGSSSLEQGKDCPDTPKNLQEENGMLKNGGLRAMGWKDF